MVSIRNIENIRCDGYISCDRCEFYDHESRFLEVDTPEGKLVLKEFSYDLSNPSHKGTIQALHAGAICHERGNFSELDFNSDKSMLERLADEPTSL
ncbi:MAG TPA: hypothetical protein VJI75_00555 [Candidatus Nanoarchaeia archaeon]|nr:hypothetical protein [Candidatus Nanoarchaeia archaeon]